MKKILLYVVGLLAVAACQPDNIDADVRPDERLNTVMSEYQQQLAGAENGWIGYLFPEGGGGYTFKFKFDNKNRVTTYADVNATTAATPLQSSYRLKATQLPSLYFDTYTYLHILADPDPAVIGGEPGTGLISDFEFSILSASTDTLELRGNLNNSKMLLVRAKADEGDNYVATIYNNNAVLNQIATFNYYYNLLTLGSKQYNITINPDQHTVSFYYSNNGFKRFSTAYAASATGIIFKDSFIDGDLRISEFRNLQVNANQNSLSLMAGNVAGTTANVATPLAIDSEAATRLYNSGEFFASDQGFTMSGKVNAHDLTAIPGFQGMYYAPKYGSGYDALFFIFNENQAYVPAFSTRLATDGKITFRNIGTFNDTLPAEPYATSILRTVTQFSSSSGYYVFQTGETDYDLVSAANSRNWIRFH